MCNHQSLCQDKIKTIQFVSAATACSPLLDSYVIYFLQSPVTERRRIVKLVALLTLTPAFGCLVNSDVS
jgi:hypothetical protein